MEIHTGDLIVSPILLLWIMACAVFGGAIIGWLMHVRVYPIKQARSSRRSTGVTRSYCEGQVRNPAVLLKDNGIPVCDSH
jgi:hypothetical protein